MGRQADTTGVKLDFLSPPLPAELAASAARLVVPILHEEFLERLLLGQFGPGAQFVAGIARDGEKVAGHCWGGWGQSAAPIGVVAGRRRPTLRRASKTEPKQHAA